MPIKKNKISYELDLEDLYDKYKVKQSKRKELSEIIGNELFNSTLDYLAKQNSPVKDGSYKKGLDKDYAKFKGSKIADLQLTSDMLESVTISPTKKNVTLKITDTKEKKKAFNHNTPKDEKNKLPQRKFIPDDTKKEIYKKPIMDKVKRIIKDASED